MSHHTTQRLAESRAAVDALCERLAWPDLLTLLEALDIASDEASDADSHAADLHAIAESVAETRACELCRTAEAVAECGEGTETVTLPGEDGIHLQGDTAMCPECAAMTRDA